MKTSTPRPESLDVVCPPVEPVISLDDLHAKLTAAGFVLGFPAALTLASRAADQRTCAHMKCPSCRRRGLAYRPYCRGNRYRVIASCPACFAAEEL